MKDEYTENEVKKRLKTSYFPEGFFSKKRPQEKPKKYIAVEKQTDSGGYIEVVSELVLCKDCIHKPTMTSDFYENGFDIEFPDFRCPCRCDDGWYNWIPEDDWFCGNGKRKEE